jgi:hypothetical protein
MQAYLCTPQLPALGEQRSPPEPAGTCLPSILRGDEKLADVLRRLKARDRWILQHTVQPARTHSLTRNVLQHIRKLPNAISANTQVPIVIIAHPSAFHAASPVGLFIPNTTLCYSLGTCSSGQRQQVPRVLLPGGVQVTTPCAVFPPLPLQHHSLELREGNQLQGHPAHQPQLKGSLQASSCQARDLKG